MRASSAPEPHPEKIFPSGEVYVQMPPSASLNVKSVFHPFFRSRPRQAAASLAGILGLELAQMPIVSTLVEFVGDSLSFFLSFSPLEVRLKFKKGWRLHQAGGSHQNTPVTGR